MARRFGQCGQSWFAGLVALMCASLAPRPVVAGGPVASTDIASVRRVPLRADVARGTIEQRTFTMAGIDVRGAYEVVHRAPDGHTRVTAVRKPATSPQFLPHEVQIPASVVPALLAEDDPNGAEPQPEAPPKLVYLMVLDHPVLAWEVQLPLQRNPEPTRKTVWLSAMTGRRLAEREQVRTSRAHVFAENPSATPEPVEVELSGIDVDGPGFYLDGQRVRSLNCVATEPPEVDAWWDEGECYAMPLTQSNADGDFFVPLPDIIDVDQNVQTEDLYAEVSMYYHSERFLDVLAAKGVTEFKCEKSTMLANFRDLEPEGDLDFGPTNNAYYTNQCDPEKGPTMLFGQGSEVDFGYDGDVVYHELGHGIVALLTPDGLSDRQARGEASLVDAGGVNEALSDYLSAMISGDPWLGDYVGRFWSSNGRPYIRSAENKKVCPDNTAGQVHNDGEPVMAALWAARTRIGEVLDDLVLQALTRFPPDASLEQVGQIFVEVADEMLAAGQLDPRGHAILVRSLDARGLLDCPRVITDPEEVALGRSMYLRRTTAAVRPFYPGPMQLRYRVPPGERELVVPFSLRPRGSGDVSALLLVKRADAPIEFTYDLVAVDDPGDPTGQVGKVREVVLVGGDWDLEVDPEPLSDREYLARVTGLEPGEVVHLMLVDTSTTEAIASDVWVTTPGALGEEPADVGPGAAPADTDDDPVHADSTVSSGCGCSRGTAGAGRVLWMLVALAAWRRRACRR